ncbi:hypothetical protein MTP99_000169 [Tenebrio molitor]|nr:hypothetical protein MTP99_000169 [Tenebrio molitor]
MWLVMLCWFSLAIPFVIDFVEGRPQYQAEEEGVSKRGLPAFFVAFFALDALMGLLRETAENGTRGPEIKLYNENGVFQVILCEPSAKGATEEPAKTFHGGWTSPFRINCAEICGNDNKKPFLKEQIQFPRTTFDKVVNNDKESVQESFDIRGNTHKKTSAEECWVLELQIRKCEELLVGLKCWEVLEGSLRRDSKELRLGCVSRRRDLDRE